MKSSYLTGLLLLIASPILNAEAPTNGTIQSLQAGDRACYITFTTDDQTVHNEMATFDICEQNNLINQKAEFTYRQEKVMAASCEGNIDCKDTDTVTLIESAIPITVTPDKPSSGIIQSMQTGDVACYVEFIDDDKKTHHEMALFDICEQENLINKKVEFSYMQENVMADSCEGNPECQDSKTVWLIEKAQEL